MTRALLLSLPFLFAACGGRSSDSSTTPATESSAEQPTDGGLTADQIRRVIAANIGEIQSCYEAGLARDATLTGQVVASFIIGPDGSVIESTIHESTTIADGAVASCIADAVARMRFDAPEPPGPVSVRFPFNLTQSR